VHEKGIYVKNVSDGVNLKVTFRRTVDHRLMLQWEELLQICSCIQFTEDRDAIIWQFESSGRYSVQSLYAIVSDRGMKKVFTPVMWKIKIPSRVHIFLWLLPNSKVLTRDNLAKRRQVDDLSCLFCSETESISHLFFECCVAKVFWQTISDITNVELGSDFESVAKL
jgi:hypothetical protein